MITMSGTPAYIQVAGDLRSQIESGALEPGNQLPSNAKLRELYSVSNTVVRDAINELRRAGLVVGQQGKGVFVASNDLNAGGTPPGELAARVQALEGRVNSLEGEPAQDLRDQVADLQATVIDLYARLGFPFPPKLAKTDAARTADPVAMSFPESLKGHLSRKHAAPEDPTSE